MYAPQTMDTRQDQPIVAEMNVLEHNLATLGEYILQLESRMGPVLHPASPETSPGLSKESRGASAIVTGLRSFNQQVMNMREKVCELRDRLEV